MSLRAAIAAILVCLSLAAAGELLGQAAPPQTNAEAVEFAARIARLVAQLEDDRFDKREAASRELAQIGTAAQPALAVAARGGGAEARWRAAVLLEELRLAPLMKLRDELIAFAAQPDDTSSVEDGMWLLSRLLHPPGDEPEPTKEDSTRRLDEMAAKVRERLGDDVDPARIDPRSAIGALRHVLVDECGFHGTTNFSNDPGASTLDGLLSNKTGTPIGLGHVMIAVARRLGITIVGVPVMGMYLIKYDGLQAPAGFSRTDVFISPIDSFKVLDREELVALDHDPDDMPAPGTSRTALVRMLGNLDSALARRAGPRDDLRRSLAQEFRTALERGPQASAGKK
jgi:regulator of sirC expression with transglutaminase-like and TPR domain